MHVFQLFQPTSPRHLDLRRLGRDSGSFMHPCPSSACACRNHSTASPYATNSALSSHCPASSSAQRRVALVREKLHCRQCISPAATHLDRTQIGNLDSTRRLPPRRPSPPPPRPRRCPWMSPHPHRAGDHSSRPEAPLPAAPPPAALRPRQHPAVVTFPSPRSRQGLRQGANDASAPTQPVLSNRASL